MKTTIEFAIQKKTNGRYEDIDTFNLRNCGWSEPVEDWLDLIVDNFWDRARKMFGATRIVKRITTEEVVIINNKGGNDGSK